MIGVIADDLTGAAEIGAVGLRHGLTAEIQLAGVGFDKEKQPGAPGRVELLCLDTDSRFCPAEEAARRTRAAVARLAALGADWVYKKVDSVLRGQVTAEVEAMMSETKSELALVLPANPGLGRVIRDGRYFINGLPINETDFASDPSYPRRSAYVREMVIAPRKRSLRVCAPKDALPRQGIVIGEVESSEELETWARLGAGRFACAGGAEFFGALLRVNGRSPVTASSTARSSTGRRELFVCGSNSQSARDFQATLRGTGVPVIGLPATVAASGALTAQENEELVGRALSAYESKSRVMLCVGLDRIEETRVAARLADCVVSTACGVLKRIPVERVFAEGGATAVELARAMNWTRLSVAQEWSPGVASLKPSDGNVELTIKPGSYAWPPDVAAGEM